MSDKEYARTALLRYMEWWSEDMYCAGWLNDLETVIFKKDPVARWLRTQAGGYWKWNKDWKIGDGFENAKVFIKDE